MPKFSGHLAIQQRVLPIYRGPFFDALGASCTGGLSLFAGDPRPIESISVAESLNAAQYTHTKNRHMFSGSFYACYQENLVKWLDDTNPDALILEANPRYLASPAAIKWMRERGRPVIGWGLGAPIQTGLGAGLRQKNWMRFLNRFDALIAYSQRGAAEYAALGIPENKIFIAHNAVSPRPEGEMLERPLFKANEPLVILFVGRLQARKRVDSLIRAFASIPKELMLRIWIVGDGPERASLEALASKLISEDVPEIRFLGERYGPELNQIWGESDLFVLPGTGGLAVQEAMSYALPVIVAEGDGTQDDLIRRENGWQIPPNDLDALIATLKEATADIVRLREMGAASWRIVSEEINVEKMVDVFVEALGKVGKG
ncbi:MAG: glycosyltransferase family 4 protein [Anaerolineales bacterium]|uniref:Glycosyltransferase family 4 protein n=1 Tax=Candidatus Desulfolinea nitratireducens TaxID=2841698 RepID=A0A8J6TE86_9CHLR|nr:glycosyltransferase family 4 protein [Candidatus Desulfolinea nitratireducens]